MKLEKRASRLRELIKTLESGKDVARRDIQLVLTEQEWEAFNSEVLNVRELARSLAEVPARLKRYTDILKRADFNYNRAEGMQSSANAKTRKRFYQEAESLFEKAIEYLDESIQTQPDLIMWLDRNFDTRPQFSPQPDPHSVPRLIGSKSFRKSENATSLRQNRRQLKLHALRNSLENIKTSGEKKAQTDTITDEIVRPNSGRKIARHVKLDFSKLKL